MKVFALICVCLVCAALSLLFGAADLGARESFYALIGQGSALNIMIIQDLRLPRTLLALVIGAGLGASGAALQGYTRNPLAAPGILGFSACAAFGAVLALYFGHARFVAMSALFTTILGAVFILILAGPRKGASTLILAGVGVGAMATALTGLIMNFAPNPWALSEIVYWLMGSLKNADKTALYMCSGFTVTGLILLMFTGSDLKTLSLGEDTARSLGVSLARVRLLMIAGVALCVGSGVAVAGAIGFIGLFVPHIMRLIFGPNPLRLIPLSAIGGAGFLVFADTLTRAVSGPGTPLYLGVLTSLIGVPFFLYLAVKESRI